MSQRINAVISQDDASQLSQNFNNYLKTLSGNPNLNFANCAWYDIDDLEMYLDYARATATQSGVKLSGIRIYLAKYNQGVNNGELTVFLAPTKADTVNSVGDINDADMEIEAENLGKSGNPPNKQYPYS